MFLIREEISTKGKIFFYIDYFRIYFNDIAYLGIYLKKNIYFLLFYEQRLFVYFLRFKGYEL